MVQAQEYLNWHYPKGQRKEIKFLNLNNKNLAGVLDCSDFINLEKLRCDDNQLIELILPPLPNLTELYCCNNYLTKLDFLSQFNPKQLEELYINNNNFLVSDLTIFSAFINLKELAIGNWDAEKIEQGIYNRFRGSLEPLQGLSKLEVLDIHNTDLDHGLEYLPASLEKIECTGKLAEELKDYKERYYYNYQAWRKDWEKKINTRIILLTGKSKQEKSALIDFLTGDDKKTTEVSDNTSNSKKYFDHYLEPQMGEFEHEFETEQGEKKKLTYHIVDVEEQVKKALEVLVTLSETVKGCNQVFFVTGQSDENEEEAITHILLGLATIFDKDIADYTTIIRTNFPQFADEEECQKDIDKMKRNEELRRLIEVRDVKVVHINDHLSSDERSEDSRIQSRDKLLNYLSQNYQHFYKPKKLFAELDFNKFKFNVSGWIKEIKGTVEQELETVKKIIKEGIKCELEVYINALESLREKYHSKLIEYEHNVLADLVIPLERLYVIKCNIKNFIEKYKQTNGLSKLKPSEELYWERRLIYGTRFLGQSSAITGIVLTFQNYSAIGGGILGIYPITEFIASKFEENLKTKEKKWEDFVSDSKNLLDNYHELLGIINQIKESKWGEVSEKVSALRIEADEKFLKKYGQEEGTISVSSFVKSKRGELSEDLGKEGSKNKEGSQLGKIVLAIEELEKAITRYRQNVITVEEIGKEKVLEDLMNESKIKMGEKAEEMKEAIVEIGKSSSKPIKEYLDSIVEELEAKIEIF